MRVSRSLFVVVIVMAVVSGFWLALHGPTRAQVPLPEPRTVRSANIAEAMLQPIHLPFAKEATLDEVVAFLRKELKANVVLDLAALGRHDLKPTSKVRLELDEIRLRTGLKLLLDQVGLATKILPEDNLLIITDKSESDEPIVRVLDEIKALHRDVHSLQDEIRNVRNMLETPVEAEEPVGRVRNPTIIEEMPAQDEADKAEGKPKKEKSVRTRPGI